MRMSLPPGRNEVDLNVSNHRGSGADLHDRFAEVWPRLLVPETGMQHAHRATIGCLQTVLGEALIKPDLLEQRFGGRLIGLFREGGALRPRGEPAEIAITFGNLPERI